MARSSPVSTDWFKKGSQYLEQILCHEGSRITVWFFESYIPGRMPDEWGIRISYQEYSRIKRFSYSSARFSEAQARWRPSFLKLTGDLIKRVGGDRAEGDGNHESKGGSFNPRFPLNGNQRTTGQNSIDIQIQARTFCVIPPVFNKLQTLSV